MSNQPIDKGRVTFIAETYQSQQGEKNRYATLGRATKWPSQNGASENITIEIDAIPIGHTGPLNLFIFWDSEQQSAAAPQGGYQQAPAQGYQQPMGQQATQGGYQRR